MVYRLKDSENANSDIEIGKPFPLQYPLVSREGFHEISPKSSISYNFPWIYESTLFDVHNSGNYDDLNGEYPYNSNQLPRGKYKIELSGEFNFTFLDKSKSDIQIEKSFSQVFQVQ